MRFTKMHGIGNDYIYVNCFQEKLPDDLPALARAISDRHFGVGSDGLILVMPSESADVRMRMFNADGSEAQMCGNGIRCLVKYAFENGLTEANPMRVETLAGVKAVHLDVAPTGSVRAATVDMGEPVLDPPAIPVSLPQKRAVDVPIRITTHTYNVSCLSMGNPHAVIFVDNVAAVPLEQVGPELERAPLFPERINVHFVQIHSPEEVTMRTWERGSGITLACGTGAAAACVAGAITHRAGRRILAHLPGGSLRLEWREGNNHVYLTGPAEKVFTGYWPKKH